MQTIKGVKSNVSHSLTNRFYNSYLTLRTDEAKYWYPFPGVEAYPIIISFSTVSDAPQTLKIFLGKK